MSITEITSVRYLMNDTVDKRYFKTNGEKKS